MPNRTASALKVKPLTTIRLLCVSCLGFYLDDRITNAAENASHLHPSVIIQLFLFEMHSHGSTVFSFSFFFYKPLWAKELANMAGHVTHTYFHTQFGFGKPFWNIPLSVFPWPTPSPCYTSPYMTAMTTPSSHNTHSFSVGGKLENRTRYSKTNPVFWRIAVINSFPWRYWSKM